MNKAIKTGLKAFFIKILKHIRDSGLPRLEPAPGIVCLVSFMAAAAVLITNMDSGINGLGDLRDFEVGRVADRDIIADISLTYIDEQATRLRMEAQEHLVPAVFRYSFANVDDSLLSWNEFCDFADEMAEGEYSGAAVLLGMQSEYPGFFPAGVIESYMEAPDRRNFREYGQEVLRALYRRGIFDLDAELGGYHPDMVELLLIHGGRTDRNRVYFSDMILPETASETVAVIAEMENLPQDFIVLSSSLLRPFIRENAMYSHEDSQLRVAEAMERVTQVVRNIEKGRTVIRRGFVISPEEMMDLQALHAAFPQRDPRSIIGMLLLLGLMYFLFIILQDRMVQNRRLPSGESCLLFILIFLYLAGAALAKNLIPPLSNYPVSLFIPTALLVMIPAVFMGPLLALALALAFPLSACLAGFFDIPSFIFALASGVAASIVLRKTEKRMDLIKAGMIVAAANCFTVIVIQLLYSADTAGYPAMLLGAALNGIVSGMLFLGVLAPLEQALNAATTFRLIELSDLNAPILRKLFTTAPGTYSHSVMVATIAEQACQDIGANALLARVGAYYHDVGKMDNPDYFVENQTDHNKHDDIAPRLSATVIRSHVKVGLEKARNLGLPNDVIDIVAEHHGNSLISWFYNKATKQEEQVNSDDFAYPGTPPRSKESAVVMLADVTEAAVRTLVKPTVAKMEKFIQQLFDAKVEQGQLSQCDLTFRDLETIKKAFVKVLAGYYHSRIEYPKTDSEQKEEGK